MNMQQTNINELIVSLEARQAKLIKRDVKKAADWNEIEKLQALIDQQYKNLSYLFTQDNAGPTKTKSSRKRPASRSRSGQPQPEKKDPLTSGDLDFPFKTGKKNDISLLLANFDELPFPKKLDDFEGFLPYQLDFINNWHRNQDNLKTRQSGHTFSASGYKAPNTCFVTYKKGKKADLLWLAPSKLQAAVARSYLKNYFMVEFGIELKGTDDIDFYDGQNKAFTIHFRGDNEATVQGFSCHVFVDEKNWIRGKNTVKRALACATHRHFIRVKFSTASYAGTQGYDDWRGNPNEDLLLDQEGKDGIYRTRLTLKEACDQGLDRLVDFAQVKRETEDDDFDNAYMCKWIDAADAIFNLEKLQSCGIDSIEKWHDVYYDESLKRLAIDLDVFDGDLVAGYDPARHGDNAKFVVMAKPCEKYPYYRKLVELTWRNTNFRTQANDIVTEVDPYLHLLERVWIDGNSIGAGVFELLQNELGYKTQNVPASSTNKQSLVTKAQDLVSHKKLRYDQGESHVTNGFMRIKRTVNQRGTGTVISTERTKTSGNHGDVAWAMLYCLQDHKLNEKKSGMSFHF